MTIKAAKSTSGMRRIVVGALTLTTMGLGASGCIEDSDCGICDPDNLVLESISGVNYASRKIHVLNPECDGGECPPAFNTGSITFKVELVRGSYRRLGGNSCGQISKPR